MLVGSLNPSEWTRHTLDLLTAIGTVGAVIVALALASAGEARRWWSRWRHSPRPEIIGAEVAVETWHIGEWIAPDEFAYREAGRARFARLIVTNPRGRTTARDVSVSIARIDFDGPRQERRPRFRSGARLNFAPIGWTHVEPNHPVALEGGRTRTADLAWVTPDRESLRLGTQVEPASRAHLLPLSTHPYRVIVSLSATDVDARYYELSILASPTTLAITKQPAATDPPSFGGSPPG